MGKEPILDSSFYDEWAHVATMADEGKGVAYRRLLLDAYASGQDLEIAKLIGGEEDKGEQAALSRRAVEVLSENGEIERARQALINLPWNGYCNERFHAAYALASASVRSGHQLTEHILFITRGAADILGKCSSPRLKVLAYLMIFLITDDDLDIFMANQACRSFGSMPTFRQPDAGKPSHS